MMFMAAPRMADRAEDLRRHLLAFAASAEGSAFFAGPGRPFGQLVPVGADDLQMLNPLAARLLARESE
jgi:hypothetical protein